MSETWLFYSNITVHVQHGNLWVQDEPGTKDLQSTQFKE